MSKCILAVDDCDAILDLYKILLCRQEYSLVTAATGRQGLEALRTRKPDLVLLDIGLPDMSGWDLLRVIRAEPEWRDIPVVVVTVLNDDSDVAHGWELDCTFYLNKPLDAEKLTLLLTRLLSDAPAELTPA